MSREIFAAPPALQSPLALLHLSDQFNRGDVGHISICGCERTVAQLLLDYRHGYALDHQLVGVGVPQAVGCTRFSIPALPASLGNRAPTYEGMRKLPDNVQNIGT